jgi:hypothetical protein
VTRSVTIVEVWPVLTPSKACCIRLRSASSARCD